MTIQGGGSMTTVSVKSSDTARLRRGPSASNRGMLDDMRDAQQALKQFTEFTRDKLDNIDKQKKAKLEEEQQRAKPAVMMSQHSVEVQPGVKVEKQPQPVRKPPAAQAKITTTVKKAEDHFETAPLYSEVKKAQQSAVSKPAAVAHKEETVVYQSVKKDKMAKVASNEYDELERPQKPYYVNQPHPSRSKEPSSPTSPTQLGSPPPTIPSYNPSKRDSFPLSNRPDYISKVITDRFGSGDLGGQDTVEEKAQPYLAPARSVSPESPPPEKTTKVVQKQVERKKSSEASSVQKKSSTSTSVPSMPVRQIRETSPPVKTGERKTSKGGHLPAQTASRQRKSPSPEYKPGPGGMRPTSPPDPLKGFSPMRPYEGMQSPPEQGNKQKATAQSSTGGGGFKKLLRSISTKTKDQVSAADHMYLVY